MKNFSIKRASTPEDLSLCLKMLFKYFKPYELVSSNEFVYYAENYSHLYPGEDYFVFKIESKSKEIIGMFSGVLLNEFITVDYLLLINHIAVIHQKFFILFYLYYKTLNVLSY